MSYIYYVYYVYHVSCVFCIVLYELCILSVHIGCCVSQLCTVDVSPVLCLHYCQPSVPCAIRIISTLLPAQCVMCVSPVLYLNYCQHLVMSVLVLYCIHVCLYYCQHMYSVLSMRVQYCVYTTASAVCYPCEFSIVFTLLPAQFAIHASSVLCLHYCQRSVLCV